MKQPLAFIAALTIGLSSCTHDTKAIEEAAYGYCKAMGEYQFDDAIPFASQLTRQTTINTFKKLLAISDTALLYTNRPATITIQKVETTSDTTAIALYHKHTPIKEIDDTVHLIVEDGKWVVHSPILNSPFVSRPSDQSVAETSSK